MIGGELRTYCLEVFRIMKRRRAKKKRPIPAGYTEGLATQICYCHENGMTAAACARFCEELERAEKKEK
jgi:hypothetical protein